MFKDICKEKRPGKTCPKSPCKKEPCDGFYFDSKVGKCKKHRLQCEPWSQNKFTTMKKCEKKCLPKLPDKKGM